MSESSVWASSTTRSFDVSVSTAFLRNADDGRDVLPPLRDAVLRWLGDGTVTIGGTETDVLSGAQLCLAQLNFDEAD